jgi:hypothetical protein
MSDRNPEEADPAPLDRVAGRHLDAQAVQQLGLALGLDWTLDEAGAIRDQLVSTHEGLRLAEARIHTTAEEPATAFEPDREA